MASALVGAFFILLQRRINMVTDEMYYKLFNELTDVLNELEILKDKIKAVQIETEEIYINSK